jgi:hypothetical protein
MLYFVQISLYMLMESVAAFLRWLCLRVLRPYDVTAGLMFHGNDFNEDGVFTLDEMDHVFEIYDQDPRKFRLNTCIN